MCHSYSLEPRFVPAMPALGGVYAFYGHWSCLDLSGQELLRWAGKIHVPERLQFCVRIDKAVLT